MHFTSELALSQGSHGIRGLEGTRPSKSRDELLLQDLQKAGEVPVVGVMCDVRLRISDLP
jgi:hypothetical protein